MPNIQNVLQTDASKILRSLVRVMLRNGVACGSFEEMVRKVYVEVKGTYDNNSSTLFANDVKVADVALSDNTQVSVEGVVTRYVSNAGFDINAYPVNASAALLEPLVLIIRPDLKLKIDGSIKMAF